MKKVAIIMGSDSDLPVVEKAINTLEEYGVPFEVHVYSAHRTPAEAKDFSVNARANGFGAIIAAAGMAAHLAGAIAANTTLPVIGIPVAAKYLDGMDALLSTVMMPTGMPVATVAVNGAANAALLAIQILAVTDAELEAKLAEENDKYMRMMAEYDNFRKRVTKEKESIYGDSLCDTAAQLLPVLDNLERALDAETDKESGMYKGVEMVMKQCAEIFAKLGIEEIEALGKEFDANVHNAVMQDSDPDKGENEITAVFQKGYKRGEKVLRYAAVKVNS